MWRIKIPSVHPADPLPPKKGGGGGGREISEGPTQKMAGASYFFHGKLTSNAHCI